MSTDDSGPRQRVVRVPGARRARLTPAPGTSTEPAGTDEDDSPAAAGPNDERMRREKPPHY
ncbi:hypothetical protein ET475_12545 [Microbacterium protaetiae]|uniref:Uncharacterized protein n=1 Tax=Microbacterium protaetiae TaxID=2509458 RepID=A0A4P6EHN8_9MICO|nr:hypothetical protein [Microbacterium protaetiae]QAY60729.1 hypothetical protein ET475_12545 [Microbacterium protaetiae]